ncbi:hypothetical protein EMIHUDRAFT_69788, partial [Emiliania huxleyi CCMP1516]|uniref:Cyclic nucleotide-binding domain-containing protein n=2 Tax=Emiliania huxleyi TaxID=2903 RepID=A0A0D3KWN8_EMIH1
DQMPANSLLCAYLEEDARRNFVDSAAEVKVRRNEVIMRQGDKGNNFYLIKAGTCEVLIAEADGTSSRRQLGPGAAGPRASPRVPEPLTLPAGIRVGSSCGELALITGNPRCATVTATSDELVLLMVNRRAFMAALGEQANTRKAAMYEAFLGKVQFLEPLTREQRSRMVDVLEEVEYAPRQPIIREGEEGTHFYILLEGEVSITKSGQDSELARRGVGDYFGELSLKTGAPTIATVSAADARCKLVRMDRGCFLRLLGPLDSLL